MNLFMAGVGNVELFSGNETVLVSKTLVDSSINLSVSLEEIRAGQGAKLYGKYAHTSGMSMKLTDAMFRMEFLAANIGAGITEGGSAVGAISTKTKTESDNVIIDISDLDPKEIYPGSGIQIWVAVAGSTDFAVYTVASGATSINVTDIIPTGTDVCVRYIKSNSAGETLTVNADFIPSTLTAVLTAPLFAGGTSDVTMATKVGTITITIPRFMLNGTTDLSMTMTGAAQMNLEGNALAVEGNDCDGNGYYAIISQVVEGANWVTGLSTLAGFGTNASGTRAKLSASYTKTNLLGLTLDFKAFYANVGTKTVPCSEIEVSCAPDTHTWTLGADGKLTTTDGAANDALTFKVKGDISTESAHKVTVTVSSL